MCIHETSDSDEIRHKRLGHIHFRALKSTEKSVIGHTKLNTIHNGTCKGRALGKNTKGSFQNSLRKTKNVLELVHSYLCGPMSTPSMGGSLDTMAEEIEKEVTIGDDFAQFIKGVGTCNIKLDLGITIQLQDVLFVPGIGIYIFSRR